MTPINYVSDNGKDYCDGVRRCRTLKELKKFTQDWNYLCADAAEVAGLMTAKDWPEFKRGLKSESKGEFAGDEWVKRFGDILLPALVLQVGMIAEHFKAPFGCAFIRCKEEGIVQERTTARFGDNSVTIAEWAKQSEK